MNRQRSLWFVLVLAGLVTVAAGLVAPEPAAAEKRLFRVQRSFFGAPFPAIVNRTHTPSSMIVPTTMMSPVYGGAGRSEMYIEPYNGLASTASVSTLP